ncbi:MAG: ATP-grasp domain-containing protein, partial [Bacteroidales bacterium]|nr:ATP-grasp domain-containing protein [Bacteroidales bacterium]
MRRAVVKLMSEERIDILIADKGGKIGEVVAKSLRRHGLRVEVFDDTQVRNDKPGYIRNLKRAIETWHPEMVIPIFKAGWLAESRLQSQGVHPLSQEEPVGKRQDVAQARHGRTMPCPMFQWPAESMAQALDTLDDKVKCSGLAERLGIPQPRMYEDSQIENIQHWPVVYKRATGLSGSTVYFPKNKKALENLLRSSGKPHLVMDYIEGYDISVDIIRWPLGDGTVFCEAAAYRVLWPKEKGISKIRVGINRP